MNYYSGKCIRVNCPNCILEQSGNSVSPANFDTDSSEETYESPPQTPVYKYKDQTPTLSRQNNESLPQQHLATQENAPISYQVTFPHPVTLTFSYPLPQSVISLPQPVLPQPVLPQPVLPQPVLPQPVLPEQTTNIPLPPSTTPDTTKPPDDKPVGVVSNSYKQQMIDLHNDLRQAKNLKPVFWSDEIAEYAQEWANYLAMSGKFEHRLDSRYGENLYFSIGSSQSTASDAFKSWAEEEEDYDLGTNTCRNVCSHYTQLIWEETEKIGCAKARSGDKEFHVCNYDPAGNVNNRRPYFH